MFNHLNQELMFSGRKIGAQKEDGPEWSSDWVQKGSRWGPKGDPAGVQ